MYLGSRHYQDNIGSAGLTPARPRHPVRFKPDSQTEILAAGS